MIKKEKGITLVSIIITIVLILIVASINIYVSLDRFEINQFNKMKNDIILLDEKVSNYYLKYGELPILREDDGTGKKYNYTTLDFEKNSGDNENYYIIDLEAMEGIALNYGKEGFENPNASDDVYIINEATHTIYYVRGIQLKGNIYHYLKNETFVEDNIPPTKPEIKVISGTKNDAGIYISEVQVEIVPGKDNASGIEKTTYSINDGEEIDIATLTNNILTLTDIGTHEIKARSYDKNGNFSEGHIKKIEIIEDFATIYQELEYIESTGTQYIDTGYSNSGDYKPYKIEAEFQFTDISENTFVFGSYENTANRYPLAFGVDPNENAWVFSHFGVAGRAIRFGIADINKHKIRYVFGEGVYFDDVLEETTVDQALTSSISGRNIALFARIRGDELNGYSKMRLYNCKFYEENDVLVRDFIPCKRKVDGVIGLYDNVNQVFYENAATSGDDFIAGPEVE